MNRRMDRVTGEEATIYTPPEDVVEVTDVSPDTEPLPAGVVYVVYHLAGLHQEKVGTCPWCESLTVATKRGYEAAMNFKRCPS